MRSRLAGWAQVVCVCSSLWVFPLNVGAQEPELSTTAASATSGSTALQGAPDRLSQQLSGTPSQADRSVPVHGVNLLDGVAWDWQRMFVAAMAMIGAVVLSLPLAFIYLRTRPAHEFDSSVLFSIVFLAATVAGILVVVQGNVARALSLAGVVSAVRFRSSLKDSNDAVYILGAIAVGLAAGSNELDVGIVISALLSATLVLLWKVRLDAMKSALLPTDVEPQHGHHHHHPPHSTESVAEHTAPFAINGNGQGSSSTPEPRPQALARLRYVVVETEHSERTRLLVETFLDREAKSWRMDDTSLDGSGARDRPKHASGAATLRYLVRFRKGSQPESIIERLKAVGESSHFSVRLEIDDAVADERFV